MSSRRRPQDVHDILEALPAGPIVDLPSSFVVPDRPGIILDATKSLVRNLSGSAGTGSRQHAHSERGNDLYETPVEAVAALLKVESIPLTVWEPACGPGAIVRELRATGRSVIATDLVDYDCPDSHHGRDFLMEHKAPAGVPCIVTNPPYKIAGEFVRKATSLVPEVHMLLRLAFLESKRRTDILERGDLARVWVFRSRLPRMHRAGWKGPKAGSQVAFAWFVWRRDHSGSTEMGRIDWRDARPASAIFDIAGNKPSRSRAIAEAVRGLTDKSCSE